MTAGAVSYQIGPRENPDGTCYMYVITQQDGEFSLLLPGRVEFQYTSGSYEAAPRDQKILPTIMGTLERLHGDIPVHILVNRLTVGKTGIDLNELQRELEKDLEAAGFRYEFF